MNAGKRTKPKRRRLFGRYTKQIAGLFGILAAIIADRRLRSNSSPNERWTLRGRRQFGDLVFERQLQLERWRTAGH